MNSITSSKTPILSSHSIAYNLVLKGIKNNFDYNFNINKKGIAKNSTNNINYGTNYKTKYSNISNANSIHNIHSSNVTKNNFNALSNRKKFISDIKYNKNRNKGNNSEIKERSSLNDYNYPKIENKNKKKNSSSNFNMKLFINNNNPRNSNVINSKKNKNFQKKFIKNSIIKSEENLNKKYINCKKIDNNFRKKNINLNNKIRFKNNIINNKNNINYNKKNKNYTTFKNTSNYNLKINEKKYNKNININEESNLFIFSPNNTFVQKTINKSTSPEKKYLKINKSNINDKNEKNNILFHRNSNTALYNNYLTSENENNLSYNKTKNQSFKPIKKTNKKISNHKKIITNNYIKSNKNKINQSKEKVVKYIKSIKIINKYGLNNKKKDKELINQNFGLKQIYENSKHKPKKPINSLSIDGYIKTEENNKTPFKEMSLNNKYNKENDKNKTLEDNKIYSSSKKGKEEKRQINFGKNFNYITFDKLNHKMVK